VDTHVRTPLAIFSMPQHLVVPLFQRPYVWDEANQWEPLWQDIRRLAEHHLTQPTAPASHFLGAVVIQATDGPYGAVQAWSIIDGQQRLTTLQLVFDATAAAMEVHGFDQLSGQMQALTHNPDVFVGSDDASLKLRHTNRDREAFAEVMMSDPPIDYGSLTHSASLLNRGHAYFTKQVFNWLSEESDPHARENRARALATSLTQSLQLVVIDLQASENSQEIFETLNARGTPLTAADLIKNFVFQRLEAEDVDTAKAYRELWPFESKFWEKEISVGRTLVTRSSLFLNQWLISRVGEEIGPKATFTRFKYYVEHQSGSSMHDLLGVIAEQAAAYQQWAERAADPTAELSAIEMNVYRTSASQTEVLKPALLWLTESPDQYSDDTRDRVVRIIESWLMRRLLLRLPSADHGRVVADLISAHRDVADADLPKRVEDYLARLEAESTYWPGDEEIRDALRTENVYKRYKRSRLRILLEAVEDAQRGYAGTSPSKTGIRMARTGFPIEHLLPQKWMPHWPVDGLAAELDRTAHVHRLGNLTLISTPLNSDVSNGPWLGAKGKRAKFDTHDALLMNRRLVNESQDGWDEARIDARTEEMTTALLATWPVPAGHVRTAPSSSAAEGSQATLKDLVAAELLTPGTVLKARKGTWNDTECEVTDDGQLLLNGVRYSTPSGAGHAVRGAATNGWWFWVLPDGRRLKDLRAAFTNAAAPSPTADA
jgi:hypothetical protein